MIILDDSPDSQKRRLARRVSSSSDVDSIGSHQMRPPSYRSVGLRYPVQPMLGTEPPQSSLSLPELEKVGCHHLACQPLAKLFFSEAEGATAILERPVLRFSSLCGRFYCTSSTILYLPCEFTVWMSCSATENLHSIKRKTPQHRILPTSA